MITNRGRLQEFLRDTEENDERVGFSDSHIIVLPQVDITDEELPNFTVKSSKLVEPQKATKKERMKRERKGTIGCLSHHIWPF